MAKIAKPAGGISDVARMKKPPEPWRGVKASGETAVAFFRRVWAPYLGRGLNAVELRRLDRKMFEAVQAYGYHRNRGWPPDIALPTNNTPVAQALAMIEQGRWSELSDREIMQAVRKRLRRARRNETQPAAGASRPRLPKLTAPLADQGRFAELTDQEIINVMRRRLRLQAKARAALCDWGGDDDRKARVDRAKRAKT